MDTITFDGVTYELAAYWRDDFRTAGYTVATGYRERTDPYNPGSRTRQRTQVEIDTDGTVRLDGHAIGTVELPA